VLFDMSGRRRGVIRWTYALLAAVFFLGFVGFGIGSERVERNRRDASAWRALSLLQASAAFERSGGHGGGERRVSVALARTAARSYQLTRRPWDAVDAQRLAARKGGTSDNLLLAQYAATLGDLRVMERALARGLREAPRPQRALIRQQARQLRRQAVFGSAPGGGHGGGQLPAP
jgi:hypothetical protein